MVSFFQEGRRLPERMDHCKAFSRGKTLSLNDGKSLLVLSPEGSVWTIRLTGTPYLLFRHECLARARKKLIEIKCGDSHDRIIEVMLTKEGYSVQDI